MSNRVTKTPPVATAPETSQRISPTKTDAEAGSGTDTTASGPTDTVPGTGRYVWVVVVVAIIALAGLATVIISDDGSEAATISAGAVAGPDVGSQEFLQRLAEQGYIPRQAVDREQLLLERAVASGDIPAATLDAPARSSMTPYERLLADAVASGHVPPQALQARETTATSTHDSGIGQAVLARQAELEALHDSGIAQALQARETNELRERRSNEERSHAASTARLNGLAERELAR